MVKAYHAHRIARGARLHRARRSSARADVPARSLLGIRCRNRCAGRTMPSSARIDRTCVSVATEAECLYWQARLRAGLADIREAIDDVGTAPADVQAWLAARRRSRLIPGEDRVG
jgi:hypothetical protein